MIIYFKQTEKVRKNFVLI